MAKKEDWSDTYVTEIFLIFVLIIALIGIWIIPEIQVLDLSGITSKERYDLENEYRKTIAQVFAGVGLFIGIYLTWRRINATEKNLLISQEGQITERFTRAIEQLGDDKLEIRLGGIYSLHRIASDSSKDSLPIMNILLAFIKGRTTIAHATDLNSSEKKESNSEAFIPYALKPDVVKKIKLNPDIQSALRVVLEIIKLNPINLDLQNMDLSGADFHSLVLNNVSFTNVNLRNADFSYSHLREVNFHHCNISDAKFLQFEFVDSHMAYSTLENSDLSHSCNIGSFFTVVVFDNANLAGSLMKNTSFSSGSYVDTKFMRVDFDNSIITHADLSNSIGLEKSQLDDSLVTLLDVALPQNIEDDLE